MRNAEREIEILKKIDHVSPFAVLIEGVSVITLIIYILSFYSSAQPCLIRTEDFYQTQDSYYIVLE